MENRDAQPLNSLSLARMMALGQGTGELWEAGDLAAILEHQLASPLEFNFVGVDQAELGWLRSEWSENPPLETFGDVFHHPDPPLELLELIKRFAKAAGKSSDSPLPSAVALVLYLASIVTAIVSCDTRITKLSDEKLRQSLNRALNQAWLEGPLRQLLEKGRGMLDPP